jgi:hypothetical protein
MQTLSIFAGIVASDVRTQCLEIEKVETPESNTLGKCSKIKNRFLVVRRSRTTKNLNRRTCYGCKATLRIYNKNKGLYSVYQPMYLACLKSAI